MAQPTYEESEAAAAELLKKYKEGTLTLDDTEMDDMENIGEIGSIEAARAGDPAKEATKEEGDDAAKKRANTDDDAGADPEGDGEKEDAAKAAGDAGDDDEAGKGSGGDGADAGADPGGDVEPVGDEKRVKDAQRKMHEATGRASRLQGELNSVLERVAALEAGGTKQPAAVQKPVIDFEAMTPKEIETLGDDYPGLAKMVSVVGGLQDQLLQANEKLAALDGDVKTTRATTSKNDWMSEIRKEHPDVDKIQGSDPFTGWLEEQPDYIRQAVYESGTVRDMVTIIQSYKDDIGLKSPSKEDTDKAAADAKKQSKLEQAREITAPTPRKQARKHGSGDGTVATISQSEIKAFNADLQNKSQKEIDDFEAKVDKAMAERRVTPD